MRKKSFPFVGLLLLVALILTASGCGGENPAVETVEPTLEVTAEPTTAPTPEVTSEPAATPVLPSDPVELCREFLTIYLTSDYEGRYMTFMDNYERLMSAAGATGLSAEEYERVTADYHACIRPYITDELYDKMCRNRDLSRWDQGAEKLGVTMTPVEIQLMEVEGKPLNYDFSVTIQLEGVHNTTAAVTGRMVMEGENAVKSITLYEYKDFPTIGQAPKEPSANESEGSIAE